jgi:hypothetical protein
LYGISKEELSQMTELRAENQRLLTELQEAQDQLAAQREILEIGSRKREAYVNSVNEILATIQRKNRRMASELEKRALPHGARRGRM